MIFPTENIGHHLFLIPINVPDELGSGTPFTHNSRTVEAPAAVHGLTRGIVVPQAKNYRVGSHLMSDRLVPTGPVSVSSLGLRTHFYRHRSHSGSGAQHNPGSY